LPLTARVLLLLARLLAAALLLAGLLARILVLLAGLILIGHSGFSLLNASLKQPTAPGVGCVGTAVPLLIIARRRRVRTVAPEPDAQKLALYKPIKPQRALLPHPVPTVKKNDTTRRLGLPGSRRAVRSRYGGTWIISRSN
jgi:hypothetical protein